MVEVKSVEILYTISLSELDKLSIQLLKSFISCFASSESSGVGSVSSRVGDASSGVGKISIPFALLFGSGKLKLFVSLSIDLRNLFLTSSAPFAVSEANLSYHSL